MGSLQPYGRVRPGFTDICGSLQSAFSTVEEIRDYSSGEATTSFCKGMKQPGLETNLTMHLVARSWVYTWIARSECSWVHEYEVPTARQREVSRQLRKLEDYVYIYSSSSG